jgi:hypothetical protein
MDAWDDAAELQGRLDSLWSSADEHAFKENATVLINDFEPKMRGAITSAVARGGFGSRRDINTYSAKTADEMVAEDALALAQAQFWSALEKMKQDRIGRITTYSQLQKYAAKIAIRAWNASLRKKHREWANVHSAIVRIIKKDPKKFAVWNGNRTGGESLVGLVQWRHLPPIDTPWDLDAICEEVHRNAAEIPSFGGLAALDRPKMCSLVLDAVRGPIRIYELVSVITKLETQISFLPPTESRPAWLRLHYTELFRLCWSAFLRLSIQQRRVLLLKWEDIEWFEIYCRVSVQTIAIALDLPLETVLDLVERLPLPDEQIAEVTSISVQSIRNLRGESLRAFRREIEKLTGDHAGLIVSRPRSIGDAIQFDSIDSIKAI